MSKLLQFLDDVAAAVHGFEVGTAVGRVLAMEETQAHEAIQALVTNGSVELIDRFEAAFLEGASLLFDPAARRRALRPTLQGV